MSSAAAPLVPLYADAFHSIFCFLDLPTLLAVVRGCKAWRAAVARLPSLALSLSMRRSDSPLVSLPSFSSTLKQMIGHLNCDYEHAQLAPLCADRTLAELVPALRSISFAWAAGLDDGATNELLAQDVAWWPRGLRKMDLYFSASSDDVRWFAPWMLQLAVRCCASLRELSIRGDFCSWTDRPCALDFPAPYLTHLAALTALERLELYFAGYNHWATVAGQPFDCDVLLDDDVTTILAMPALQDLSLQDGHLSIGFVRRLLDDPVAAALRARIQRLHTNAYFMSADATAAAIDLTAVCPLLTKLR